MSENEDKVLDEEQWKIQAQAIINDVKCHVRDIEISKLGSSNHSIYLNITTLEALKFCIEVSSSGFSVVGNDHDIIETTENQRYETPYTLLDVISPQYKNSFGNALTKKLNELAKKQIEEDWSRWILTRELRQHSTNNNKNA